MTKRLIAALMLASTAMLGACQPDSAMVEPQAPLAQLRDVTVTGQLAYRERIALPPGSVLNVKLLDISLADAASKTIAEYTQALSGVQPPLGFRLVTKEHKLKTNMRYAVRATITDPDGKLAWTTDTIYPVQPSLFEQDLGMLKLVKVAQTPQTPQVGQMPVSASALTGNVWRVEDIASKGLIDGSHVALSFGADGRLSGSTGCNRFTGTYAIENSTLNIGPLGMTRRACVPALGSQEHSFVSVLSEVTMWNRDDKGRMVLSTDDGRTITATVVTAPG